MTSGCPLVFYSGGFAPLGGIESFTKDLLLALRSRGVPVQLVCWGRGGSSLDELEEAGVEVYRSSWRWGCRWGWPDRFLLWQWRYGVKRAGMMVYCKTFGLKTHRELHRLNDRATSVLITPYRPLEFWAREPPDAVSEILGTFDSVIIQAESFERDLRTLGFPGRVHVLPYVPPPSGSPVSFPVGGPLRIGYLGRLAKQKNLVYLLRAFSIFLSSRTRYGREAQLHIFGDGPEREILVKTAAHLGILSSVKFRGEVPRAKVPSAIDSCHMFAITSITEGQCLAALEILSRGRPLVATPVGALPEVVSSPDAGILAPLGNPQAYSLAMAALERRIESREVQPAQVTHYYAARFPREHIVDEYVRILGVVRCANSVAGQASPRRA